MNKQRALAMKDEIFDFSVILATIKKEGVKLSEFDKGMLYQMLKGSEADKKIKGV